MNGPKDHGKYSLPSDATILYSAADVAAQIQMVSTHVIGQIRLIDFDRGKGPSIYFDEKRRLMRCRVSTDTFNSCRCVAW